MTSQSSQPQGNKIDKKREKWSEDYLDAVDLRPAHEKQLEETDSPDLDATNVE